MQNNQEYVYTDRSRLPIPLGATLTEVEETAKLIHTEVEEVSGLLHHNLLKDPKLAHSVLQNLLHPLLNCIRQLMVVDTVALLLPTENAKQLAVCATLGLEEEVTEGIKIPIGRGFAGRVAASGRAVLVDDLSTVEVVSPILRNKGLKSMLGVPLLVKNRVVGVFHIGTLHPRQFTKKDAQLLQLIAYHVGLTLNHLAVSRSCITKFLALAQDKFNLTTSTSGRRLVFVLQKLCRININFDFYLLQKLKNQCARETYVC